MIIYETLEKIAEAGLEPTQLVHETNKLTFTQLCENRYIVGLEPTAIRSTD